MSNLSVTNRLVLLADDNDETAFVIEAMLDMMDFAVERVRNGQDALEMSAAHAYALILMDIEMPVMDDLDATKAIRSQETVALAQAVPIVGITGHSDMGTRRLCQLAGMDDVLCKPFLMEQLEARSVVAKRWWDFLLKAAPCALARPGSRMGRWFRCDPAAD